ncbi:HIV Tat-specific factor 1 homolog [Macrosteles quadrilineatus]|uniref:HIV Tat-specific factor 1 homolog n=1 Tax=Macrosteles quadrilineatus TaxID=74068 RepID=UPI0023E261FA|nr:HIV Tat-specific factor 1 homolog [Macrosteles quadrilineatus]
MDSENPTVESELVTPSEEAKPTSTAEDVCESKNEDKSSTNVSPEVKDVPKNEMDEANLHYDNGVCIYTDPESKLQYTWDDAKQEWVDRNAPDALSDKDYQYDGKTYTYTDKETNVKYTWNEDKKEWDVSVDDREESSEKREEEEEDDTKRKNPDDITSKDMSQGSYSFENDTHVYTDPSDGSKYFWDKEKNAWFPQVDDDFLAKYQMSYGFVDPNANDPKPEPVKEQPQKKDAEKRKAPQTPAWFEEEEEETTKVYVSGLPLDITEQEFIDVMQKCGLVMRDETTKKMKVKLYLDPETSLPKGDALCTYIKKESVELALKLLDGSDVRGHCISVERAKFTMKGQYDPTLKPKKKRKKDKEKLKKIQEKLFAWMPDKLRGERAKHEKIVIVKNLFEPEMFDRDVKLILEYQQDLREECLKCGAVKKVVVFDRHPEGVAQISFKEFEAADACIQLLNGRWFGQRKITAELWDGHTKYKITETDEEIQARRAKWEKFLLAEEEEKEAKEKENKEMTKDIEVKDADNEIETEKKDSNVVQEDSDADTKSSVGSEYDTDEEVNN